ncbi:MAG: aminoacyl-tRNA hydrolase [Spirochaetaceae bacterium]|nr:aminoacyl-tRNA hydrolase [Spirochaetaceae bacterium]
MIRLYAFLGNYGKEFSNNRHNVAWQFLESLPFYGELSWTRKFKGLYASRETSGERILLLKPETYMNSSGESIIELMRFYRIEPGEVLAVHDELEMAFGAFGFKFSGGLGGHNGLRSMEKYLGTRDFARLRFGIGRPDNPDVAGYVLSDFSQSEREILMSAVFPQAGAAFMKCLESGFDAVKDDFKKKICL